MRVLIWATSLQADILALAQHLDGCADVELLIAAEGLDAYRRSVIARVRPLAARLLDMNQGSTRDAIARFAPDMVVCDNHYPHFEAAPRVCSMWHGLGWKARPQADIAVFYRHIKRLTGIDPRAKNPRFLAQCYGERDRAFRIENWGLDAASCRTLGMAFSDLLRAPPYDKSRLESSYQIDIGKRKTLLLNLTWHYGRIFPGTWQPTLLGRSPFDADLAFLERLFVRAHEHGANVLFCMHDKKRYERAYLEALHKLAKRYPYLELRHKDEHPDNLSDLVVADAMVSNLSSFITYFYHFGRPSVHICPPPHQDVHFARMWSGLLTSRKADQEEAWMNEPTDNGGLTAFNADEVLAAVERGLLDPSCCEERAAAWIRKHVADADGHTCERFADALREFAESA